MSMSHFLCHKTSSNLVWRRESQNTVAFHTTKFLKIEAESAIMYELEIAVHAITFIYDKIINKTVDNA